MSALKPLIGITQGDPAGIGPEIIAKALIDKEVFNLCRAIVIGDARCIEQGIKIAGVKAKVNPIDDIKRALFLRGTINVLDLKNADPSKIKLGKVSKLAGKASVQYLLKAIDLAKAKKIDAITTAPINKEAINKAGYRHQGHTEILAKRTKTKNYGMLFVSDKLWVILATTHLPLAKVSRSLKEKKIINIIKLAHKTLSKVRKWKPKIGVAGLNPHAGEAGLFGKEEIKIIKPAVDAAKKLGINVKGPISPDAIFNLANAGMFDIVVAMYHDQGLIPLKLLSFNYSVNMTVGLPIIRTSVDHGTGFDIAGKGWANPSSLIKAIEVAAYFAAHK